MASVWRQTVRPGEIIIVDDGTSSKEAAVLGRLADAYPSDRVRIIKLAANQGPGRARNIGWLSAKGDLIAFLDADDIWHPQKIEIQLKWFRRYPQAHLLCGETAYITSEAQIDYNINRSRLFQLRPVDLLLHNPVSTRTVMLRRTMNLRFAEHKDNSEDYQLYLTAVLKGFNLFYCQSRLAYCFKPEFGDKGLSARLGSAHRGHVDTLQQVRRQGLISPSLYIALRFFAQLKHYRRYLFLRLGINKRKVPLGIFLKRYIPFFRFK